MVVLNRIFISHLDNEPNGGKFVNDNVGIDGLVIENNDVIPYDIVATLTWLLEYIKAPELFVVGWLISKFPEPYVLVKLLKLLNPGDPRATSTVNVLVPLL